MVITAITVKEKKMNITGRYKNGNYVVSLWSDGSKIRETEEDKLNAVAARTATRFMNDLYMGANVVDERYLFF